MSVMSFSHTVATTASLSLLLFSSPIAAQPSQIHLAIMEEPSTSMSVQFSTPVTTQSEQVIQYGNSADDLAFVETTASYNFTDGGSEHYEQTFHIGEMKHLKPHTRNYYRVGSDGGGWSDVYDFVTAPVNGDTSAFPLRFGIWGDMGHTNSQILMSVKEEVENNNFDMILHVGDFAYDMHDDNGHNGDAFMNDIQPMAARVPYMVDMGNHEHAYEWSHYTERFRNMPHSNDTVLTDNGEAPNNWFFSWDYGNVHFAAINTEVLFVESHHDWIKKQYEWLENDLKNVDRTRTPWVVVHGHRPMYCSCDTDCDHAAAVTRTGAFFYKSFGLEKLLYDYGVDLYIAGHEHNYERMYDVYDEKTTQSTTNPPATVHIITGDAGGPEQHEKFKRPQPDRTAFRTDAYGYSRMTVFNATTLLWEQVETDTDANIEGKVIDSVFITQEKHGPFARR